MTYDNDILVSALERELDVADAKLREALTTAGDKATEVTQEYHEGTAYARNKRRARNFSTAAVLAIQTAEAYYDKVSEQLDQAKAARRASAGDVRSVVLR